MNINRIRRRIGFAIALASGIASASGPCDIYQAAGTPCVAAHSTTRALYASYSGNLYQVRRASDKTTQNIGLLATGGVAKSATQDAFCSGTTCTISEIYDQSPKGNHLVVTPVGGWLGHGGTEATATAAKIKLDGHVVYGVYTTGSFDTAVGGVGYRNNKTTGVATGDQPEGIYAVVDGKHYNQWCCFDYGNAETNNLDDGKATMEAIYYGNSSTQWGKGNGTGPWVMADLEDGLFAGQSFAEQVSNTTMTSAYVTAMVKGNSGNSWAIRGGDAQSGSLKTLYSGARPTDYNPMKKQGAIILGIGGDNSHTGQGTFFEGCMTSGFPTDATDAAVQANIVAAGYGSNTTSLAGAERSSSAVSVRFDPSRKSAVAEWNQELPGTVRIELVDLRGAKVATLVDGEMLAGLHKVSWSMASVGKGVLLARFRFPGSVGWSARSVVPN